MCEINHNKISGAGSFPGTNGLPNASGQPDISNLPDASDQPNTSGLLDASGLPDVTEGRPASYFSNELRPGLFLIGLDMGGAGVDGTDIIPGHATSNSYLVVGRERALLVDSMGDIPGFKQFAEQVAGVPVMLALSHGHVDHIVRLKEFDEFWIHRADEALLHGAYGMPVYDDIPETVHYLESGDVIDLGGRCIDVINIPGHSRGSLLFLDRQTRTLISGDTIARRLLYGLDGWTPLDAFTASILALNPLDFDGILSAHDRILLPKAHIAYMVEAIRRVSTQSPRIQLLGVEFLQVVMGDENTMEYQDITIPASYIPLIKSCPICVIT